MTAPDLRPNMDNWQERVDLAAAFRWTVRLNMHEAVANHFSLAINPEGTKFLMNPNQMHFSRIKASDLIVVDANDPASMEGPDAPDPTAWGLHGGLHRYCKHARCAMHVHSPYATALASLADSTLPPVDQNACMFFNRYVIDNNYGGLAFEEEGARCASLLEKLESQTTRRSKPMPLNTPYIVKDLADKNYHNDRKLAMRGWFLEGNGRATDAHRAAAERVGVSLRSRDFNVRLFDTAPRSRRELEERGTATQVAGTGSLGGYNVPTVLVERIEKALLYFNPLREYAQVLRTESGEPMTMPTNDDTGTNGVQLAEDGALTVADTSFGQISLGAYTMSSKALKVSWQLLDDNAVDLETYIGDLLGERLGRIMADYVATGTGSSQPQGIAASTAGKTTASATAITSAEILDLIHSVDIAYRQDPSCALVMHDSVWLYVRKLVDSNGQPLFQESYRIPGEIRIHGFPLVISNSLNNAITTGLKTMVFGAMNKFLIRDVANIRIQRLDELYAANGAVGFTAWARTDSKILASGAIKHMVQA